MTTRLLEIATQSLTGEVCPERPRRGGIGERFRQNHTLPLSVSPVEGETDISSSQRSDKTTPLPILLFWVFKLPYGSRISLPITRLELCQKATFLQLTHQSGVHEGCRTDVGEPGILQCQQSLHVF